MDEEFYFEESNPKKAKLIFISLLAILVILTIGLIVYKKVFTFNVKKTITYEVGTEISMDVNEYVTSKIVDEKEYKLNVKNVSINEGKLDKVGEYTYKVRHNGVSKKGTIKVIDTTAPSVEVNDLTLGVGEDIELDEFIKSCEDYSKPCTVLYVNESDDKLTKNPGNYKIKLSISDAYDNKITKTVNLTVKKGYDSKAAKKNDLKPSYIIPNHDDWNNKMIVKFSKGVKEDDLDEDDKYYNQLLDIASSNLHDYLDPLYDNNGIVETEIIEVFNKYDYVIGYAMRVKLDNGLFFYLEDTL